MRRHSISISMFAALGIAFHRRGKFELMPLLSSTSCDSSARAPLVVVADPSVCLILSLADCDGD